MRQFIGRKKELAALQNLYNTTGFQMVVMYGRRRVGKSTLLQNLLKGKRPYSIQPFAAVYNEI